MTNMTNAYKMAIDNVAAKIRGSDTFNAFEAAKYLGAAFCKSEDDIIVDLIRSTAPTASAPASTPSESAAPVTAGEVGCGAPVAEVWPNYRAVSLSVRVKFDPTKGTATENSGPTRKTKKDRR